MEGLLSTGPSPSSFVVVVKLCYIPVVHGVLGAQRWTLPCAATSVHWASRSPGRPST